MRKNYTLYTLLTTLIEKQIVFAAHRKAGEDNVNLTVQFGVDADDHDPFKTEGFIMQAFENTSEKIFIRADLKITFENDKSTVDLEFPEVVDAAVELKGKLPPTTSKARYLEQVEGLIEEIRTGGMEKVVLSRVIQHDLGDQERSELFMKALDNYPMAFVYLINLPNGMCWLGASPEKLLVASGNSYQTVSLAGTRKKETSKSAWGQKEIREQELVSQRIEECFSSLAIEYVKKGPETVQAGNLIEHLQTTYSAVRQPEKDLDLLGLLHPTPAVCGQPFELARKWIVDHEDHDRSYYTGFLGPVHNDGGFDLYVNLRCAQLMDGKACIYVGGGITADSDAEAEWLETEMKSRTMLDMMHESSIYS